MSAIYIVAINGIFRLKLIHYGPKGDILDYWGMTIFWVFIPLYPRIWEDSYGTMVSAENTILVSKVVFFVQDKIIW